MSIFLKSEAPRRSVLRGMLNGGAVGVALPFLDCFLNDSGTALAAGRPLPVRFGTWFWGLGHSPGIGVSSKATEIELLSETQPLARHLKQMNYFNGFNAHLDGSANLVHYSGLMAIRTGTAPSGQQDVPAPTLDVLVADAIGGSTRFRSLDLTTSGGARSGYSARTAGSRAAAEVSPLAFYVRVFGPEFADPNKADFKPDPTIMVRQSVLSGVYEDSKGYLNSLGAADRSRLDAYFTSIRELEGQLALQLQKPAPNEACKAPARPAEAHAGAQEQQNEGGDGSSEITQVIANHKTLTKILAMAVACDQTRVFNMTFSSAASGLRRVGVGATHHTMSHEEPLDPKLGYQVAVSWFNIRTMESLADFVDEFAAIKEGAGTLLDNTLLFAHSDTNDPRVHAIESIPVVTFGKAGGRFKTGVRVIGNGDPVTRIGLTAMQAAGVGIEKWGTKSNETSRAIGEVFA